MKIDNFDAIRPLLNFESKDDFYFVTLFRRKKDDIENWTTDCNNIPVKNYYIKSLDTFDKKKEDIVRVAEATNARVYFWLNKRSFKKCSMKLISAVATNIETENYEGNKGAFDSVCGSYPNDKNKKWIIDYDIEPSNGNYVFGDKETVFQAYLRMVTDVLKDVEPKEKGDKIISVVPTVNGKHIITKPFDVMTFHKLWEERTGTKIDKADIKKDSPTLLYYSNEGR